MAIEAVQMLNLKPSPSPAIAELFTVRSVKRVRIKMERKTVQAILEQYQLAIIESINNLILGGVDDDDDDDDNESIDALVAPADRETDELSDLVKSRVECPDFLKKLESVHGSFPQSIAAEEGNSWDMVGDNDIFERGNINPDQDDFVVIMQEDIVDSIACFMATYLLSLKETKDLNPSQLQQVLRKTFSVNREKGKLMKAWDGSKVVYNMASWGATAIGIYQNPAILTVASSAFWTSCRVISKLF